ncbi:MAG TPA: hypothetical protein VKK31_15780 [Thermoanaerobaculia bacterium]|nr:hypothetical protein [Thermoanaerobaculia bacterium]
MKTSGDEAPVRRPEKQRWGVFLKGAAISVILALIFLAGGVTITVLQARYNMDLPWFDPVERACRILCQLFLAFALLCKIATQIFEQD